MSHDMSNTDEIETCAGRWILRKDRGELTPADRAELEAWLSKDSRHREAYLKLDEAWLASAGLKAWRLADGRIRSDILDPAHKAPGGSRPGTGMFAIAASVVLVLAAGLFTWQRHFSAQLYGTEVGGYERVLLDDGSVLQLNTDTRLQVRLTDAKREVRLLRGQAHFEIARDPQRPFEVLTDDTVVRAVGTAFDVHRQSGGTRVTVTEGRVSLTSRREMRVSADAASSPADTNASAPLPQATAAVTLTAGEVAETRASGTRVVRVESGELDRLMSWQTGELHFQNQPLASVVAEFNRYNRRHIEIVDAGLAAAEVNGNFKPNDLRSFLEAMQRVLAVEVEVTADTIRIHAAPASSAPPESPPEIIP